MARLKVTFLAPNGDEQHLEVDDDVTVHKCCAPGTQQRCSDDVPASGLEIGHYICPMKTPHHHCGMVITNIEVTDA